VAAITDRRAVPPAGRHEDLPSVARLRAVFPGRVVAVEPPPDATTESTASAADVAPSDAATGLLALDEHEDGSDATR
jgi:hypothetical protein